MPARTWMFIIAIGLGATAHGQDGPDQPPPQPQAAQEQASQKPSIEAPMVSEVSKPTDMASAKHDGATDQNPDSKPRYRWTDIVTDPDFWWDRATQWVMAIAAIGALILSFWAVIILKKTLKEADATNKSAIRAANAAEAQVEATRRPRLKIRHEVLIHNENGGLTATIFVENTGDAKARIKHSEFIVHFGPDRPVPRHWKFENPTNKFRDGRVLEGGWRKWTSHVEAKQGGVVTLMGGLIYTKVGDKRTYRTFFCREYDQVRNRFAAIESDPEYERED